MPAAQICSECGQPLPGGDSEVLCPVCALRSVADDPFELEPLAGEDRRSAGDREHTSSSRPSAPLPRSLGDYELLEEIARGGMGVVFRARQKSLDRIVALKLVIGGPVASAAALQRFQAEAQTAAGLQHPNIVAIHEVGEHEGQAYFSMDYIEGRDLAQVLRDGPLPPWQAAGYVKVIAEAIEYAHQRGILHRDLKPSNVLIDPFDRPRITDFGLAKRLSGDSELTVGGQVLGSPNFMAPEQAQGALDELGPWSDVYSIGALLYHLITGRPPFQAATLTEVLRQVVANAPAAPRLLNAGLPIDLETICLKCLEKEPGRRYPTAQALADELGRFLGGRSILARPIGPVGKTWRWCRRKPQVASLAGVAALAVVLGFAGVTWQWRQAEAQRRRAEVGELAAQQRAYISDVNAAQAALKLNNPARALELLNRHKPQRSQISKAKSRIPPDLRGFEWKYLWQQCQTEAEAIIGRVSARINTLEVSPDGHWLLAGSDAGAVKLWNLSTGDGISLVPDRARPNYATFSPDNRLVVFTDQTLQSNGIMGVWDIQARKRLAPILAEAGHPVGVLGFSPDGKWLVVGAAVTNSFEEPPGNSRVAAPSWGRSKRLTILEVPTWRKVRELNLKSAQLDPKKGLDVVVTPDNRSVIIAETEPYCRIALWEFAAGAGPQYFPAHQEGITAMALSPDGRLLATGSGYSDHLIRLWQVPSFRSLGELSGHEGWITGLRFSQDGQTLASASADRTIRLWRVPTKEPSGIYSGLGGEPSRICLAPDDQELFSGEGDGAIFRWSAAAQQSRQVRGFDSVQTGLKSLELSPDWGQYAGLRQGGVYLGKTQPGTLPSQLLELGTNNNYLLFSSDGRSLLSGAWTGEVQVWSLDDHLVRAVLRSVAEPVCWLGQDARGQILVAVHRYLGDWNQVPARPHQVSVWSQARYQSHRAFAIPGVGANYAVSPDGNWLAAGQYIAGNLQVWALTGSLKTNTLVFPGDILAVAFSADSKLLAAATMGGKVRVWEVRTWQPAAEFRAAAAGLFGLGFSPDGRRLATAGASGEALRVWDLATWQQLIALNCGEIHQVAFSADGNRLTGVNSQGDIFAWRVPSLAEIEARERQERLR